MKALIYRDKHFSETLLNKFSELCFMEFVCTNQARTAKLHVTVLP